MDKNAPVSTIMSSPVVWIEPQKTMEEVRDFFVSNNINHLPVCENGRIAGMISRVDYSRLEHHFTVFNTAESREHNRAILQRLLASDVMSKDVETIGPDATLEDAARIFQENRFHALPVVNPDTREMVGIITAMDLLNYAYNS